MPWQTSMVVPATWAAFLGCGRWEFWSDSALRWFANPSTQGGWAWSHLTCARIDASFRTRVQDAVSGKPWEMLCVQLWTTLHLLSHAVLTSARAG